MSKVNDTNYTNQVPLADDYTIFVRDSDGVIKTATMQQLADLFASLAALNLAVTVISAQQTLTTQQLVVTNSGSAFDLDLPASSLNTGRTYRIYNKGAGAVTITPNGSDTIGGAASLVLAQGESVIITSDGIGNWATFGAP
jgi:hypothetical protein